MKNHQMRQPHSRLWANQHALEPGFLFSSEGEDFHHKKGDWYTQYGGYEIADNRRIVQPVVEYDDDDILNDVVWDIGNKEFYKAAQGQGIMKYKTAVHPAGAQVGQNVANVKGQVGIGYEKGA